MISVSMYGRFGNHLWQYAVCRTVAEKRGFSFHIPRNFENHLNCYLGEPIEIIDKYYPNKNNHDHIQKFDSKVFEIEDGTKLDGYFQSEKYILDNRSNILNWFKINDNNNLLNHLSIDENTCVINFRGGDYSSIKDVFLDKKYYYDSIDFMLKINSNMKFMVITDDINLSKFYFPDYNVHHFSIIDDFTIISKSKYLIISNSTFSWWAAWLNNSSSFIIAPKYWMRHNVSNGYWSPSDSLTKKFNYLDRDGKIQSYEECYLEIDQELNYSNHY